VVLWDGIFWRDLAALQTQVCSFVWGGNLTKAEWDAMVPLAYRKSCPN
jgi:hypothetical protein